MCCFMTEKKLTKREKFAMVREILEKADRVDLVEFVDHEVELLNRKTTSSGKLTPKQEENEKIKNVIVEVLAKNGDGMTVTQLMKTDELSDHSMNKLTALVTQLKKEHRIFRFVEKRVTYFRIPTEEDVFED